MCVELIISMIRVKSLLLLRGFISVIIPYYSVRQLPYMSRQLSGCKE
jgi:hypothetical protein